MIKILNTILNLT